MLKLLSGAETVDFVLSVVLEDDHGVIEIKSGSGKQEYADWIFLHYISKSGYLVMQLWYFLCLNGTIWLLEMSGGITNIDIRFNGIVVSNFFLKTKLFNDAKNIINILILGFTQLNFWPDMI